MNILFRFASTKQASVDILTRLLVHRYGIFSRVCNSRNEIAVLWVIAFSKVIYTFWSSDLYTVRNLSDTWLNRLLHLFNFMGRE